MEDEKNIETATAEEPETKSLIDNFSELNKYINVIVCGICFCMGIIFKNSCDFMPTRYIPLVMATSGIVLNIWLNGWKITPEILLGGLVSGLSSTGAWEAFRNTVL